MTICETLKCPIYNGTLESSALNTFNFDADPDPNRSCQSIEGYLKFYLQSL